MKNKHLLPIVLAVAMVLSGIFAPRFFLRQSENRLLHAAGGRDGKEIAIYQGQIEKDALSERIELLSLAMGEQDYFNKLWEWKETRSLFDSELSTDEASQASSCLYQTLQKNGRDIVEFPERKSWKAPYEAYFTTDIENLAISFWFCPGNKDLVILDAVSGVPVICNLLIELKNQCTIKEIFEVTARTYNTLYADRLGYTFMEEAEVLTGTLLSAMAVGSAGPYVLTVNYYPEYHMVQIRLTVRIDNSDTSS